MAKRLIDEVRGALACGLILISTGACILFGFSLAAVARLGEHSDNLRNLSTVSQPRYLVPAAIVTVCLTVLGFFVTRSKPTPLWFTPTWYLVLGGLIPGVLLLVGWYAAHAGLAMRKEARREDFRSLWNRQRGTVVIAALAVLLWVVEVIAVVTSIIRPEQEYTGGTLTRVDPATQMFTCLCWDAVSLSRFDRFVNPGGPRKTAPWTYRATPKTIYYANDLIPARWSDIKAGADVSINYHLNGKERVADKVEIKPPAAHE